GGARPHGVEPHMRMPASRTGRSRSSPDAGRPPMRLPWQPHMTVHMRHSRMTLRCSHGPPLPRPRPPDRSRSRHATHRFALVMTSALEDLPGDLWVFGYGSLIWRPGFDFVERREARLVGAH